MIVEIDLPPDAEARLRERASQHGQTIADYLLALAVAGSPEGAADYMEAVAGIRRGMADGEAGREITLEEYHARISQESAEPQERAGVREAA